MPWFLGHLIGDFIIQNDWMALNKKEKTWNCVVHVALYTLAIMVMTQWPLWAIPVVAIPHFIQDRTNIITWWMDLIGQYKFRTTVCAPWSSIVVDNTFHLIALFLTDLLVKYIGG